MSLESVFKLSLIMNMVDHLTGPMAGVSSSVGSSVSKLEGMNQTLGNLTKSGAAMAGIGAQITDAALAPVEATFETRRALGELTAMGVKDLATLENAAKDFSDTWAGTTKSEFLSAAIDIKGGIDSLNEEGIAKYTELSGVTAKATGSTIDEMTSLFATGYGIYKDYYDDLSDIDFAEVFSAGIAQAILTFKASGSSMAQSITALGGAATTANVPLEEQLTVLGMLQATMSGSEAGTKYRAFLRTAAKAGEDLGLSFIDANKQLKSMPEVLDALKSKYGETLDAVEKQQIQTAFGSDEAVALIDLMYSKTDALQGNILTLYDSMGKGSAVTRDMAEAINKTEPEQYEVLQQRIHNVTESIGNSLLPTVNEFMGKAEGVLTKVGSWIENNQELVRVIMLVVLAVGGFLTVAGTTIAVVGGVGLVFTKTAGFVKGFWGIIKGIPSTLETIQIMALYAGDGIKKGFSVIRTAGAGAISGIKNVAINIASMAKTAAISGVTALKNMAIGLVGMAKQAIVTAATAMPGLIASVWSFTAALLANPITWIIIGIVALVAAIILLWQNWDTVTAWLRSAWDACVGAITAGIEWLRNGFQAFLGFFASIGEGIRAGLENVRQFFQAIIDWIGEKIAWFGEAGKKIIDTLVNGIKSVAMKPIEAVKGIFEKVRNLLPFSDAKEGPLSTLTLSGQRTMTTYAEGVALAQDAPSQAIEQGLDQAKTVLEREPVQKVSISGGSAAQETEDTEGGSSSTGKTVIIQKLLIPVDLKKIKDLQQLLKLLAEVEGYANGNDDPGGDPDAVPQPV